jgi:hypothetical protein
MGRSPPPRATSLSHLLLYVHPAREGSLADEPCAKRHPIVDYASAALAASHGVSINPLRANE